MDERSKKFTSRNTRINLSDTLAMFKPKQPIIIPTILIKLLQKAKNMHFCSL